MHLHTRNVNTAFKDFLRIFSRDTTAVPGCPTLLPIVRRPSRNGPGLTIDEPVTVTYEKPRERVLFNAVRDANPFFHLYESLWMLAGRNDVAPVAYYAKQMREYSDDGKTLNGGYGYRWRHESVRDIEPDGPGRYAMVNRDLDQLDVLVAHLKADPTSRRAVLQMWNVEDDLLKIGPPCDANGSEWRVSKDVCCNLSVMFALREGEPTLGFYGDTPTEVRPKYLDMTVTNRSNDLLWGMLGANYVHFTILQEYLAARLGVEVGRYHHFTNNLHVYETRGDWKPAELLAAQELIGTESWAGAYYDGKVGQNLVPLVRDQAVFEEELPRFVEHFSGKLPADELGDGWKEPFLADVAAPLLIAWACHKEKDYHSAFGIVSECVADDWRIAAESWLTRRMKK